MLSRLGLVRLDARLAGEVQHGDVAFEERRDLPAYRRRLGLLGELARGRVLFEAFRNPVTDQELRSSLKKLYLWHEELLRHARRRRQPRSSVALPALCVLSPPRRCASCAIRAYHRLEPARAAAALLESYSLRSPRELSQ